MREHPRERATRDTVVGGWIVYPVWVVRRLTGCRAGARNTAKLGHRKTGFIRCAQE
jgi:hypothetical protein